MMASALHLTSAYARKHMMVHRVKDVRSSTSVRTMGFGFSRGRGDTATPPVHVVVGLSVFINTVHAGFSPR